MKKIIPLVCVLGCAVTFLASLPATAEGLVQQFQTLPRQARPWVYWVWTADTTHAAITRDLTQMKTKDIVGCIL